MTAPFLPIDSGQGFPEGLRVEPGRCDQCGADRDLVRCELRILGVTVEQRRVCAECLADFVAGAPSVPGASIWPETLTGEYHEVRGRVRD